MSASHPVIHGGTMFVLLLLVGVASAPVFGRAVAHRYVVRGSLEPAAAKRGAATALMDLSARLSPPTRGEGVQSGGDFVVLAKLAQSPSGCGDDTIFVNGFDLLN
jgi:hypothetical protein